MTGGSDYRVLMELPFGEYRRRVVEDQFGQRWDCTCPEYIVPEPPTPLSWSQWSK
jgi:hypothetical protein